MARGVRRRLGIRRSRPLVAVRVRHGQATFRKAATEELGPTCATVGEPHEHGWFLLRRDVHRVFDLGHLAVDSHTMTVDVAQSLLLATRSRTCATGSPIDTTSVLSEN